MNGLDGEGAEPADPHKYKTTRKRCRRRVVFGALEPDVLQRR